jgi:hypothetical protein
LAPSDIRETKLFRCLNPASSLAHCHIVHEVPDVFGSDGSNRPTTQEWVDVSINPTAINCESTGFLDGTPACDQPS